MKRTIAKIVGLGALVGMFAFAAPQQASADTHVSVRIGSAPRGVFVQQRVVPQPGPYYNYNGPRFNRVWERGHWSWFSGRRVWIPGHWVRVGGYGPNRYYGNGYYG